MAKSTQSVVAPSEQESQQPNTATGNGNTGTGQGTDGTGGDGTQKVEVYTPRSARDIMDEANEKFKGYYVEAPEYAPPTPKNTIGSYEDLLAASMPKGMTEKERKSMQTNERIAAIGDALTAIINAAGAVNGANAMELNPKSSMTAAAQARYDKYLKSQKADRKAYNALMLKAIAQQDKDNAAAQSAYERQYKNRVNEANRINAAVDKEKNNYIKYGVADEKQLYTMGKDARDYNRGVFESDRNYNRGVFTSDRAYNRGVYEDNRDYNRGVFTSDRAYKQGEAHFQQNEKDKNKSHTTTSTSTSTHTDPLTGIPVTTTTKTTSTRH